MIENQILHGDSFEIMAAFSNGSIDMILTDPPYAKTACKWDTPIDIPRMMQEFFRVIKPNGAIVITATQPFATDVINAGRKYFRYDLIWEKAQGVGFLQANKMPLRSHECILIFYKKLPVYNPQKTISPKARIGRVEKGVRPQGVYRSHPKEIVWIDDGTRLPTSIIRIPEPERGNANRLHPTQKPLALFEWLVKTYTHEGDTVLDPFAGSGTTALACKMNNRKYIVIEKEEEYVQKIHTRLVA